MNSFFPDRIVAIMRSHCARHAWASEARDDAVRKAQPWASMSDEALWDLMFGHTITRSWMVWSDGWCPSCRNGVPMYQWEIEPLALPWKVRCPHCREAFPKNDFAAFHRSGLDQHLVFDPKRADRSLLYNTDHPGTDDPLRAFGVDDGEGYMEGGRRWRFIGAYLIYGQWKRHILAGIEALSDAWLLTGERRFAHKALVVLDRVADLYGSFDFEKEGLAYERGHGSGYVSTWHDACEEARALALHWDKVRGALEGDGDLVSLLSRKARDARLANPKTSAADVRRNIEDGILADTVRNRHRIKSNFPQTDITVAVIQTVLGFPNGRAEVDGIIDMFVEKSTAVDGVTGEKGMAGYSCYAVWGMTRFLGLWDRSDPDFLPRILVRFPKLRDHFRFHVDTWCLQKYYPSCGDSNSIGERMETYVGAHFEKETSISPSAYTLLWRLAALTGEAAFLQVLHGAAGSADRIPLDLFLEDPEAVRRDVAAAVGRSGTEIILPSVNKEAWRLAILRSGRGDKARAAWLDYDNDGNHRHADGMNLGLYGFGMDLMADFGYPPVNYGGWGSPRAEWYKSTSAHCTVLVDRREQSRASGATSFWKAGAPFQAVRASCPDLYGAELYERTVALVDVDGERSYVMDVFRVTGGREHLQFLHTQFAALSAQGIPDMGAAGFEGFAHMRGFRGGPAAAGGILAEWAVQDRFGYLPAGADVRVRVHGLTMEAEAFRCEAWVNLGFSRNEEAWIPRLAVRRSASDARPLSSTFLSVIEPFDGTPFVARAVRLPVPFPAVETVLADGRRDLFACAGQAGTADPVDLPGCGLGFRGDVGWARLSASGALTESWPEGAWRPVRG